MNNIGGTRLSTWKTIVVTNNQTGEKARYELDKNERLIDKIKPNRRKHIPQQNIKIRITKKFWQKHKKLDMILDNMIASYNNKNKDKKLPYARNDNNKEEKNKDIKISEKGSGDLYKDLMNQFFLKPEEYDAENENEFIPPDEINFLKFN